MKLLVLISKLLTRISHIIFNIFESVMCILYNNLKGYTECCREKLKASGKDYMRLLEESH